MQSCFDVLNLHWSYCCDANLVSWLWHAYILRLAVVKGSGGF